jgi:hypothetical protein
MRSTLSGSINWRPDLRADCLVLYSALRLTAAPITRKSLQWILEARKGRLYCIVLGLSVERVSATLLSI